MAVTQEHVERFERMLKAKAAGIADNHMRYLSRALADLGYELSPERLPEYIAELYEVSPNVARLWFISKVLAAWREPPMYGLEADQTSPDKLFTRKEAETALSYAEEVRSICYGHLF